MKLTELHPRFDSTGTERLLVFDCPKHCDLFGNGKHNNHTFQIPLTGPQVWHIDSEDFESLTMTPSVRDSTVTGSGELPCGVHFVITKGDIQIL
jgi:hypothetical protein